MSPAPSDFPFEATPDGNPGGNPEADGGDGAAAADESTARIAELEAQLEEAKKERLLALAEAENAGRRADKRITDNAKYAVTNIAKALLQVADNLGRALLAAPAEA